MLLTVLVATLLPAAVAWWFDVPLGGGMVLLDLAGLGALVGALLSTVGSRMRRRPLPLRALAVASALATLGVAHLTFAPAAPAVIVLVVDCLRADRFNATTMPRVFARTATSVRFLRARSQSSWTRSAMPSLLSGRYPVEHGLYRTSPPDRIDDSVVLAAEHFRSGGWLTAAFVDQAQLDPAFGYGRGFGRYGWRDGSATRLSARFERWNTLFRSVPRFVLLHYIDVHGPYRPKGRYRPTDLPASDLATAASGGWRRTIRDIRAGRIVPTPDDWAHLAGLYDGEVRQIDARIGAMLGRLESNGTLDAAWLVFTADHGERFGERGAIEHMGAPDETVLAVPLLVRPPGGAAPRVVTDVVQHVDLLPTLLAAVNLPADPDLPGRDLAPALRGAPLAPAPSFAEEWAGRVHHASVRAGDWKLLRAGGAPSQLYDLGTDASESRDLAAEHPETRARLESMLAAYFSAGEAGDLAGVDWAAAAAAGAVWTPGPRPTSAPAELSDGTLEALEALGYLDAEDEAEK